MIMGNMNIILGRRNPIKFRLLFCLSSFGRLGVLYSTQIYPNDTKIDQNDQLGLQIQLKFGQKS